MTGLLRGLLHGVVIAFLALLVTSLLGPVWGIGVGVVLLLYTEVRDDGATGEEGEA